MTTITTPSAARIPAGTWLVDPVRSRVGFAAKQLGIVTVRGEFREFEATIEAGEGPESFRVYGVVQAGSLDTANERRDEHLRSAAFLAAASHPYVVFESTRFEARDDDSLRVIGRLRLHGITREIELAAEIADATADELVLRGSGTLSRADFGMRRFRGLVTDKVEVELSVVADRQGSRTA
jgi:polyisoprenoid-binding protein YceI